MEPIPVNVTIPASAGTAPFTSMAHLGRSAKMKSLRNISVICATLLVFGCVNTKTEKSPFVVGNAYSITSSGAYWRLKIDGLDIKVDGPIRIRILELRPPAWAQVELLGENRSPFWIDLQNVASISEIK